MLLASEVSDAQSIGKEGKWEVEGLAREIKMIEGVLSVGLFAGMNGLRADKIGLRKGGQKPVAAYFGMEDGSVVIRKSDELKEEEAQGKV